MIQSSPCLKQIQIDRNPFTLIKHVLQTPSHYAKLCEEHVSGRSSMKYSTIGIGNSITWIYSKDDLESYSPESSRMSSVCRIFWIKTVKRKKSRSNFLQDAAISVLYILAGACDFLVKFTTAINNSICFESIEESESPGGFQSPGDDTINVRIMQLFPRELYTFFRQNLNQAPKWEASFR